MRRVRYYRHGGPEVLRVERVEPAEPGPGELLVRVEAIGVSLPAVRAVRDGGGGLPGILASDIAGTVVSVGPDVTGFGPGDRVTSMTFTDAYADVTTAPAVMAARIPDGASAVLATALMRPGHLALAALGTADPRPTESVLVTGAASATGHLAVQLAKIQGVPRVVAAVGSPAKKEFVRALGADEVVTYGSADWGEPVDVVLDGVGGEVLPRAVAALAPGGRLVFFASGGGTIPAFDLLAGSRTVTGLTMGRFVATERDLYDRHGERLWKLAAEGRLRPAVHAEIPLEEAARAHEVIEARANLGKVVLVP